MPHLRLDTQGELRKQYEARLEYDLMIWSGRKDMDLKRPINEARMTRKLSRQPRTVTPKR